MTRLSWGVDTAGVLTAADLAAELAAIPDPVQRAVHATKRFTEVQREVDRVNAVRADAYWTLVEGGMSVRQIAALVGHSPTVVSNLTKGRRPPPPVPEPPDMSWLNELPDF